MPVCTPQHPPGADSESRLSLNYEGLTWECFKLEVTKPNSPIVGHFSVYCTSLRADKSAKIISKQFKDQYVTLSKMARIKALYLNGERLKLNDYRDFYVGLSDTQHEATKLYLEDTRTWE